MEQNFNNMEQEMPQPAKSPMQTAMKYGLIGGLVYVALSLLLYLIDMQEVQWLGILVNLAVLFGAIYLAQTFHRDNELGGYITYGRAVSVGMLTALFLGIVAAVYTVLYFNVINPAQIDEIILEARQNMIDQGMSDEEMEQAMKMTSMFMQPWFFAISTIFSLGIIGLIVSLVSSAFTRK